VALPDVAPPGVALPDVALPDVALPDVALPDVALPDVALPDVALPDVALLDVALLDVAPPDVAPPDVAPPDVAPGGAGASAIGRYRDAPWITATPGTLCHQMTLHACRAAGFTPHTRHQVDDFTTTLALVAAGQGVALVPQLGLAGPPAGIALTRVPLHRRTSIAYRSGAGGHPAVTAFAAALRSAVPRELGLAARDPAAQE
jgi:DNA-binding transcriptional LysR family regulator